jgi:acetyl esterase
MKRHNVACAAGLFLLSSLSMHALAAEPGQAGKQGRVEKFSYKKTPQAELAIDVHFPADWKAGDKRPAIVFFFGGGWTSGTVEQFRPQAEYFASRGLVTARADYRVRGRHQTPPDKCVEDCKSAVRWLRQNAAKLGVDPDRIVASGGSAGGHTAAATAIVPGFEADGEDRKISSRPNLLVLFNPVMNTSDRGERIGSAELARAISPNDHLTKDVPPAIIFFGTSDGLLATAQEYVAKARPLGLAAELYTADGQPHGFFNRSPWRERTLVLADQFLAKFGYVKGEPTVEAPAEAVMKLAPGSSVASPH